MRVGCARDMANAIVNGPVHARHSANNIAACEVGNCRGLVTQATRCGCNTWNLCFGTKHISVFVRDHAGQHGSMELGESYQDRYDGVVSGQYRTVLQCGIAQGYVLDWAGGLAPGQGATCAMVSSCMTA